MTVHLKAGESYSLTTGRVFRTNAPSDPMDRPVKPLSGNDMRAMYAAIRKSGK